MLSQCKLHALAADNLLHRISNGIRGRNETSRPRALGGRLDEIELRDFERFAVDAKSTDYSMNVVQLQNLHQSLNVFVVDLYVRTRRRSTAFLSHMSKACMAEQSERKEYLARQGEDIVLALFLQDFFDGPSYGPVAASNGDVDHARRNVAGRYAVVEIWLTGQRMDSLAGPRHGPTPRP